MRRILKWEVTPGATLEFSSSETPVWLGVGFQGSKLVAWCEADLDGLPNHRTRVVTALTGWEKPFGMSHVGTAQTADTNGDPFVVHVYAGEVR